MKKKWLWIMLAIITLLIILGITLWKEGWKEGLQRQVPELTPSQKEEDFMYITKLARDIYPLTEALVTEKGLDSIVKLESEYIRRAKETKNNLEFLELFYEYMAGLGQAGHAQVIFDEPYNPYLSFLLSYRQERLPIPGLLARLGITAGSIRPSGHGYSL